ncbi:glycosyltransferase family 87 protein [Fluviicola taffensis]|uniref:DUF2029 domain-containing protein n=1 Tax=Fluviicola taffensis (strain DSM 16823 / NCIMB 13979 / RW262) TaxID=755732 RepID=F2ICI2_FLUTR|nr:glycosyltransferase family 87 protein [Fluviicola taffensis]AEA45452.1 hypothetical protein Fluta_3481 [Fluviicola taffensis DSM 16823]
MEYTKSWSRITRSEWIFTLFLVAFCTLFAFVEWNNGRLWTSDFQVYYEATRDFFAGNNPYQHNYGLDTGFFKYTPFTLYLFAPQTAVSFGVGQCIHLILLAFSLIYSFLNIRTLLERFPVMGSRKIPSGMLYLAFACVAIHITRELHLGNVNLLLLLFFNLGLKAVLQKKNLPVAIWWSLMVVLKPIMIFVLLPLVFTKQWKSIALMAGFGILFFLFPAIHVGFKANWTLWQDWFKAISAHGEYLTSNNSIATLVKIHTGFSAAWITPLICLLTLILLLINDVFRFKKSETEVLFVWTAIFSAFIPNFFTTDTEHFLLSLPLIWLLFAALLNHGKWFHWIGFGLGMLLFSFNSPELLGDFSDFVSDNGLLGIGNCVFIITFLTIPRNRQPVIGSETGI